MSDKKVNCGTNSIKITFCNQNHIACGLHKGNIEKRPDLMVLDGRSIDLDTVRNFLTKCFTFVRFHTIIPQNIHYTPSLLFLGDIKGQDSGLKDDICFINC